MEKLKGFLTKRFEPVASAAYAWRNFKKIAPNYDRKQWLSDRKTVIEASLALGSLGIIFGFGHPNSGEGEALRVAGACVLTPAIFAAPAIGYEFMKLGREELFRQARLAAFKNNTPHRKL